ncbi:MAG: SIMPL domain-containing protein [Ignavibacteria bacterium]
MKDKLYYILPAGILSAGIIICTIIISLTWSGTRKSDQTITVTGSAKKEIISDIAFLRGSVSTQASTAEISFNELNIKKAELLKYLSGKGFSQEKVNFFPVVSYSIFELGTEGRPTNKVIAYNYSQRVEISSTDVQKIKEISLDISSLINRGVSFMVEMPEYHYTKLADVKIEIQAEAAKDAKNRAEKIATSTGRSLGILRNARMGILQITPKFSNMVSDYGVNDVSSIEKEITAVVTASFAIE